eukprot:CAMPEP_0178414938 /NCGR_PEP_ID=MMETSP0689_2-20121128/23293_1 /TAXON_ID=160604 /ORGANISM="Amphidinium massartii, Strain CS-259" /LENGTH=237 /DNA_ID=CAMNT_0020036241 /DNA_START=9 /DNA_END=718 /DNA_ORIENTATION=+
MAGRGAMRDADSFYVEDCRSVQSNTHSIQTLTGQISRLIGTMDSEKDFLQCRKLVDDAVNQATETRTLLMRIQDHQHAAQNSSEKTNRRMMYHKLSDNLAITARVLEDVVRRFNTEEKKRAPSSGGDEVSMSNMLVPPGDAAGGNELQAPVVSYSMDGQGKTMKPIDEDMKCLQRIYTDLTSSANDQQSAFETLEHQMAEAKDLERGDQIDMGKYDWERRRQRKLYAAAGGVGALVL